NTPTRNKLKPIIPCGNFVTSPSTQKNTAATNVDAAAYPIRLAQGAGCRATNRRTARRSRPRWSSTRYSITWSRRPSTDGGIVSPRALAVLRLMTNSNFVGCSTGRSAGLAALGVLVAHVGARREEGGSRGQ